MTDEQLDLLIARLEKVGSRLDALNDHWGVVSRVMSKILGVVIAILTFVVFSMLWTAAQRRIDVAELRQSQRQASVQIAAVAVSVEYLAKEEAARKRENERSKADRAQLNARATRAEADRRAIEAALRQIGEIREAVGRMEKAVVGR